MKEKLWTVVLEVSFSVGNHVHLVFTQIITNHNNSFIFNRRSSFPIKVFNSIKKAALLYIEPNCAQWRHIQCKYVRPELGTLILCISRSMLDLLVINLFFNRTQSGVQDSFGQRLKGTLIILILKLKVTRVDIEIKRWVSNTKASSSVHNIWKNFWCEIFSIIQIFALPAKLEDSVL